MANTISVVPHHRNHSSFEQRTKKANNSSHVGLMVVHHWTSFFVWGRGGGVFAFFWIGFNPPYRINKQKKKQRQIRPNHHRSRSLWGSQGPTQRSVWRRRRRNSHGRTVKDGNSYQGINAQPRFKWIGTRKNKNPAFVHSWASWRFQFKSLMSHKSKKQWMGHPKGSSCSLFWYNRLAEIPDEDAKRFGFHTPICHVSAVQIRLLLPSWKIIGVSVPFQDWNGSLLTTTCEKIGTINLRDTFGDRFGQKNCWMTRQKRFNLVHFILVRRL